MHTFKHFLKALTCLALIALAQKVTQAQINIPNMPNMPNMPNIPNISNDNNASGDKKYIIADARKKAFVPSTLNMHQHDILVFVADKSADWQTFSYYVNQNNKKCEKDASSSSSFISKGSSNDGLTAFSSLSLSLGPGSFYYVVGNFDNNNKCDMTLTATVVADDKPTTDTPNPISNTTNSSSNGSSSSSFGGSGSSISSSSSSSGGSGTSISTGGSGSSSSSGGSSSSSGGSSGSSSSSSSGSSDIGTTNVSHNWIQLVGMIVITILIT